MFDAAKFTLFITVSWALIIASGPAMLYVITRGMAHGRRAGILSAMGVVCGDPGSYNRGGFWVDADFSNLCLRFLIVKYLGAISSYFSPHPLW